MSDRRLAEIKARIEYSCKVVAKLYASGQWKQDEIKGWEEYCAEFLNGWRHRTSPEVRGIIVKTLVEYGMSTRAIGALLNVSAATVSRSRKSTRARSKIGVNIGMDGKHFIELDSGLGRPFNGWPATIPDDPDSLNLMASDKNEEIQGVTLRYESIGKLRGHISGEADVKIDNRPVYLIMGTATKKVKIGVASDPVERVRQIQFMSPDVLYLVDFTDGGGVGLERAIHRALAPWHFQGEWFYWNSETRSQLESLNVFDLNDSFFTEVFNG